MVYMEPDLLGWRPLMLSWLPSLALDAKNAERLSRMFDWLVPGCLRLVTPMQHYTPAIPSNLVVTLMAILASVLPLNNPEDPRAAKGTCKTRAPVGSDAHGVKTVEGQFLFALTWSIGGSVASKHRQEFDR